ncbi:COR domain-containing protein [Mucilaginibacter sp. OK098]|uniref:TIR domain-containing protein n=1 Tax=Mucilaginibacter sp. OK098 TaxID=1855297 RepID=UPI000917E2F2|nr:COR domain-containing protein [Mucilaginibacter sp. OK098]SHN31664.1 Ran GTPase-activating protein (RanGAP) involved in mRNA processing and transport [Mucilaginibacter sp. OK098]
MSLDEALFRITEIKKKRTDKLDLSGLGLTHFSFSKELLEVSDYLTELNISNNRFGYEGALEIGKYLKNLSVLNISFNNIGFGGTAEISRNLKNLLYLNISDNNIGYKGSEEISKFLKKLSYLDISANNIGDDGVTEISRYLKNLSYLKISSNNVGYSGASEIGNTLKNLSYLDISDNSVGVDGTAEISKSLENLIYLNINSNNIGSAGVYEINRHLKNLSYLNIGANNIGDDGAAKIAEIVKNLSYLNISSNDIGDDGAVKISTMFNNLFSLNIASNNIADMGVSGISKSRNNLFYLDISNNNIEDHGAGEIGEYLKSLSYLDISFNKIGDDGAAKISNSLKTLSYLNISSNNIGDNGINTIYIAYKDITHTSILLSNNKTSPVLTSATTSWDGLRQYFDSISIKEKNVTLRALNILLLGNTFSGKSSLQQFYLNGGKVFEEIKKEDRTWGITHNTIESPLLNNLRLSFWDFGGQEYFHGTHRLFIGGRNCLYLVLWEAEYETMQTGELDEKPLRNENNDECYPAAYWLGTIHHFEQNKDVGERIMVLQSRMDVQKVKKDAQKTHTESWPSFLNKQKFGLQPENSVGVSIKGASSIGETHTRRYYEARWNVFKIRFEQLIKKYKSEYQFNEDMFKILGEDGLLKWRTQYPLALNKQAFLNLCHAFYAKGDDFIIPYLENSGDILTFKDNPILSDAVFLNPEGLLNSIYGILNQNVKQKGGVFLKKDVKNEVLLNVMIEMDLVFENPQKPGEFIAPQFMNENAEISKLLSHLRKLLKIAFSLRFPDFMPRGMVTRFISKKGKRSVDGVFWKYGVMYHYSGFAGNDIKVLVEADENNRFIRVYADDKPGRYNALIEVYDWFAMQKDFDESKRETQRSTDKNSQELKERKFDDKRLGGDLELSIDGQNYADIEEINNAIDQSALKVRDTTGGYMSIDSMFYVLLNKTTVMPKKIFFSYSRYDKGYREELDVHFATLKRQGLIATWYDGEIEAGMDANAKIKTELENADIVLFLLSPHFIANDYIVNIEMKIAKEQHKTVVPITIRACDYKKFFAEYFEEDKQGFLTEKQFYKGQGNCETRERDIIWIASEQHAAKRDEYYNFIVEGVKRIIER